MSDIIHQAECGFFDPMSNYDAAQIGAIYERIIGDGIFQPKKAPQAKILRFPLLLHQ